MNISHSKRSASLNVINKMSLQLILEQFCKNQESHIEETRKLIKKVSEIEKILKRTYEIDNITISESMQKCINENYKQLESLKTKKRKYDSDSDYSDSDSDSEISKNKEAIIVDGKKLCKQCYEMFPEGKKLITHRGKCCTSNNKRAKRKRKQRLSSN